MAHEFEIVKKCLPYFCRTDCEYELYDKGLTEDGAPISTGLRKAKCLFPSARTGRTYSSNSMNVTTEGEVIIPGDAAPELKNIEGGTITIDEVVYEISRGEKPKGFDPKDILFTRLILK